MGVQLPSSLGPHQSLKLPEELRHCGPDRHRLLSPALERTAPDQHRTQPVNVRVEIPLRRRNRPVPQEKLDLADIDPSLEQMSGQTVAKDVR